MELLRTGGIVSSEVWIEPSEDLWAWPHSRERPQSEPQWQSDGQVALSNHGSPPLGRSQLSSKPHRVKWNSLPSATADTPGRSATW